MKKIVKIFILAAAIGFAAPTYAQISVGLSVRLAPPPIPVYVQPECPVDGYLWQPGYWAYNDADGYYWVPGVWVAPPDPGLLWTPSYWGYDGGVYLYHAGYWGAHVGFYGGINYGFGYPGVGFIGGGWSGSHFRYNTAVFSVNRTVVHNTYVDRTVIHNYGNSRASFNGGPGGINRQPSAGERQAMNEHHVAPTHSQISHQQVAGNNPTQRYSANHGKPSTPAMARPNQHVPNAGSAARENNRPNTRTADIHPANVNHAPNSNMNNHQPNVQPQHNMQPRPEQQQHVQQQRPEQPMRQEQTHAQPQQHTQAPPQQHMQAPPQQHGGGGEPHGGGGGGGQHHHP